MLRFSASILAMLLCLSAASPAHAGALSRWSFDETGGDITADGISGLDGVLQGQAAFAPDAGIRGGAIQLSAGTSDLVNMGDHYSFTGSVEFSLQAWVKTTSVTAQLVVGRHISTVVSGYWLGLNDMGDGPPLEAPGSFHLYQSDMPQLNSGDQGLDDGQWHQILAVRDAAAGHLRLYVDGRRVPDSTSVGSLNPLAETTAPFLVGGFVLGATPTGLFTGMIDEVRVWDHALSDFEAGYYFEYPDAFQAVVCGDTNDSRTVTAGDALFVLRSAVGSAECLLCACDANDSGQLTASDALRVLQKAVGQDVSMACPGCIAPD